MTENPTKIKKRKKNKLLLILPLALVIVVVLGAVTAVGVISLRYRTRFLPGTEIAGVDCSGLTVEGAAAALHAAAGEAHVILRDGGTELAAVPLSELLSVSALRAAADAQLTAQRLTAGPVDWLYKEPRRYTPDFSGVVGPGSMEPALERVLYADTPRTAPEDAYIALGETGYTVVPEVEGNLVDMSRCGEILAETVGGLQTVTGDTYAAADGVRILPEITADSPEITGPTRALDEYLELPVALDFAGGVYTLTPEDIWSASSVALTPDAVECTPDLELVRRMVDRVVEEQDADGVGAKFAHTRETRDQVYTMGGDEGWIMDREDLSQQVFAALSDRTAVTAVPSYDRTWFWKDYYRDYGVGDSFLEISLDNQYVWYYVDGELIVETPVVTGNLADPDSHTRRGCFNVTYRTTDCILRGPTWEDHVDFWIPFDGNIGMHDSSWRDQYGGDIYLEDGSHGCINTPLEAVRIIFEYIRADDIVIVY